MRSLSKALLAALLARGASGSDTTATPAPLYREATNQFAAMRSTLYQHKTQVNRSAGSYRYDCVGFVSYALKQAAPEAWNSVAKATSLAKGRIPSPPRYRAFFASLAASPQPGWAAVTNAYELKPGDVVAWEHRTARASGHAVIVGSVPEKSPDGSLLVEVYDSTSSPHSEDSRRSDPRAGVLQVTGRPSGLGHGRMVLVPDPATGALIGLRWGLKSSLVTVPIAAGRPLAREANP